MTIPVLDHDRALDLQRERAELAYEARHAKTAKARKAALVRLADIEDELATFARDLERDALVEEERKRRAELEQVALEAARRADLRAALARHAEHRSELARVADEAMNTLTTMLGAWVADGQAMDVIAGELGDTGRGLQYASERRATTWVNARLSRVFPRVFYGGPGSGDWALATEDTDPLDSLATAAAEASNEED